MSTPPTVGTPKKLMTVDEYWDFVNRPENMDRNFELIRGEVVEMSRPRRPHGSVAIRIGAILDEYARKVGRGYVAAESGVVLSEAPGTVVGPDIAYYTDADKFDDLHPKWGDVPPILAVEIRSPNDRMNDLIGKIGEYLGSGVKSVWLVDYEDRTVSVFRPNANPCAFRGDQVLPGGEDLPGFSCQVSDFFRLPGDQPAAPPQPPPQQPAA